MMLSGFVFENLAKGALIGSLSHDDRVMVHTTARLPNRLLTHNLRSLARRLGVATNDEEEELLHRMTLMVKWDGRCPVASEFQENSHLIVLDDGRRYSATWIGESDVERCESVLDRVRDHVGARRSYRVTQPEDSTPSARSV
jgi:hypothetical protein